MPFMRHPFFALTTVRFQRQQKRLLKRTFLFFSSYSIREFNTLIIMEEL